jgi:3-hydroxyisobutyrate dehydrogenase-like beta-hydroxyacid dehydrogenase
VPDDKKLRVGILSPGDMGSAVGRRLHEHGAEVYGVLTGRSDLTRTRAAECGFSDAGTMDDLVRKTDIILSILVPSEAPVIAHEVVEAMKRTGARPVFAECNAIAPVTVEAIAQEINAAGGEVIDAGIIGGPPNDRSPTYFHCSGPNTAPFERLADYGLTVKVAGPRIGQASGVKMMYAAGTKGTTALWTEILTSARALGLEESLYEMLADGPVYASQKRGIPMMPHRARRWVGEMEEIALTFKTLGLTPKILEGAADMYRFVGGTKLADQTPREPNPPLDTILDTLSEHLNE